MTHQEARRIVEASTRFEVRDGSVWLRELRWLRAVARLRADEAAAVASTPSGAPTGSAAESPRRPHEPEPRERRAVPIL